MKLLIPILAILVIFTAQLVIIDGQTTVNKNRLTSNPLLNPCVAKEPASSKPSRTKRGVFLNNGPGATLWPQGVVYYKFDANVDGQLKVLVQQSMLYLTRASLGCIMFVEDNTKTTGVIVIYKNKPPGGFAGNYACVGYYKDIAQILVLDLGPTDTNLHAVIIHEIIHALGFVHEFQRHDRNSYVKLNHRLALGLIKAKFPEETNSEFLYDLNFGIKADDTKGLPFDFKSIMLYPPQLPDGQYWITEVPRSIFTRAPVGSFHNMGQHCKLSVGDRNLIERAYYKECGRLAPFQISYPFRIPKTDCGEFLEPEFDETFGA